MESLRAQVALSASPISAEAIAKKLVKANKLTPQEAKELLSESEPKPQPAAAAEDDDLMELAPIDDEEGRRARKKEKKDRSRRARHVEPEPEAESKAEAADEPISIDNEPPKPKPPAPPRKPAPPEAPPVAMDDSASLEAAAAEAQPQRNLETRSRKRSLARMLSFGRRGPRRRKRNDPGTSVWDTKLMLVGGGMLLTILIAGVVLWWVLSRESGDKVIGMANEDYAGGLYAQAINKYDQFLNRFPNHDKVSFAKVRKGLAQMRQSNGTGNWPRALQTAEEVLPAMRQENAFKEGRDELRTLLPAITEGLAKEAQQLAMAEKPEAKERLEQTRRSLDLIDKNILKSHRPTAQIEEVNSLLAIAERQIAKDEELTKAVGGIRESIAQKKVSDAYLIRDSILKKYPDLSGHEKLAQAVLEIAEAEKAAVVWVGDERQPGQPPVELPAVAVVKRTVEAEPAGAKEKTIFAAVEGALYGLDAADGKVLWRRWIGLNPNVRRVPFQPVSISGQPGGDCLMYDAASGSLMRIAARSGEVAWVQNVGLDVEAPATIAGKDLFVASRDGKLVLVNADTGIASGHYLVPQSLTVPPTVEPQSQRLYQPADHSNLYVIDLKDRTCKDVVHLGHAKGAITTAPVAISRFLIIADNAGARQAELNVFAMTPGDKEGELTRLQTVKIEGHVDTQPIIEGAKLLVTTDIGATYVFQITGDNEKAPLQNAAAAQGSGSEPLTRYCLLRGSGLWVGDAALTCFDIQSSRGDLKWKWTACENSVFTQPLVAIGDTIYSVRRRREIPGSVVSATAMSEPKLLWETNLAVVPVGDPVPGGENSALEMATAAGALFEIPLDLVGKTAIVDEATGAIPVVQVKKAVSGVCRFPDGTVVLSFGAGSNQVFVFDPKETPSRFRPQDLPGTLGCNPAVFRGGLVVPTSEGQVFLINPRNGDKLVEPFQPEVAAGTRPKWLEPTVLGDDAFLISDGQTMLYRIGVAEDPVPHLAAAGTTAVGRPLAGPLAAAGPFAVAVDTAGTLMVLALPDLKTALEEPLGGRPVWGPVPLGQSVLVQSSTGEVYCIGGDGKTAWKKMLEGGPPVGAVLIDGDLLVAMQGGEVARLDAKTGEVKNRTQTGRPLHGIIAPDGKPILIGHDGSIFPFGGDQ